MIEIIPNWHPLFVHFTVGLLSTSVLFYIASACLSKENLWKKQWLAMANWSLWSGCLFAIGTAIAGWFAYNSVAHDSASHAAMTLHRNWALPTAGTFLLLGFWAIMLARKARQPGFMFLSFSIIAAGVLMVTGWLGAEAVYRYGLGVISLPKVEVGADGHNHSHEGHQHEHEMTEINSDTKPSASNTDEHNHSHEGHQHEHEMTEINSDTKPSASNTDGHNHSHGTEDKVSAKEEGHQHEDEMTETSPNANSSVSTTKENTDGHSHSFEFLGRRKTLLHSQAPAWECLLSSSA